MKVKRQLVIHIVVVLINANHSCQFAESTVLHPQKTSLTTRLEKKPQYFHTAGRAKSATFRSCLAEKPSGAAPGQQPLAGSGTIQRPKTAGDAEKSWKHYSQECRVDDIEDEPGLLPQHVAQNEQVSRHPADYMSMQKIQLFCCYLQHVETDIQSLVKSYTWTSSTKRSILCCIQCTISSYTIEFIVLYSILSMLRVLLYPIELTMNGAYS